MSDSKPINRLALTPEEIAAKAARLSKVRSDFTRLLHASNKALSEIEEQKIDILLQILYKD